MPGADNGRLRIDQDWLRDFLELWEAEGWGWALWTFEGPFGVLDSGREDVDYDDWYGHDLDREMLELLQAHWPAPSPSHRAAPRPSRATVFRDRRLALSSGAVPYHWLLGPTAVAVRRDPVVPVGAVHSPPAVCPISAAAPPKIYCA